jgi:hypothetical protein
MSQFKQNKSMRQQDDQVNTALPLMVVTYRISKFLIKIGTRNNIC